MFLPGDGFFEQILVIEKAERDILALRDRYHNVQPADIAEVGITDTEFEPKGKQDFAPVSSSRNPDNVVARQLGGETSLKCGSSVSSTSTLKDGPNAQPQEKYLKVPMQAYTLSTANVYQSSNRSNSPGLGHPGFSTDTRGNLGFFPFPFNRLKSDAENDSQYPGNVATTKDTGCVRRNKKSRGRSRRHEDPNLVKLCPTPPPGRYPHWMSKEEIHLNECARYARITQELIEVPAKGSRPHMFLCIEPPVPTELPNVRDVGPRWVYAPLIADNVNTRTAQDTIWAEHIERVTGKKFDPETSPLGRLYGRPPRRHDRVESDDTSVIFNNIIVEPPKSEQAEYVGYSIGGNVHQASQDRDPFITPQPLVGSANKLTMNTQSRLSSPGLPHPSISPFGAIGSDIRSGQLLPLPPRSSSAGFPNH
jgi:hypothetical protein